MVMVESPPLTDTEQRVYDLMQDGMSDPQIAERLVVSVRTVESHVASIKAKLGGTGKGWRFWLTLPRRLT